MSRQSGFGTETSMVILTAYLHQGLDGEVHPSWYCWTFQQHIIDHGIGLEWLAEMELGGTVPWCFHFFLPNKSQKMILGDICLRTRLLQYGVPRVYPFPHFLNIYVELLRQIIQEFGVGWHQYVDDAQLCFSMLPTLKIQWKSWAACLNAIRDWMEANKLKF